MALNERRNWLIAYDIAQPKRLGRVHRYVKSVAIPMQYSLYVATETAQGIRGIRDELAGLINAKEDDVRIYQLPSRARVTHYGRRTLPESLLVIQADVGRGGWTSSESLSKQPSEETFRS